MSRSETSLLKLNTVFLMGLLYLLQIIVVQNFGNKQVSMK